MGFVGLGGLFFVISPTIRQTVLDGIGSIGQQFELYAPYSYVAGVVLVLTLLMMSFYRGAQQR
jgi:hypothetical protein